jgi:ribosomal protein S7
MLESKNQTKFTPDQHIFLKFIGCLIKQGKKQKAWRIFTETLENIAKETKKHLIKHVNNVKTGNFLKSLTDEIINCFKNNNSKLLAKRKEIYKLAADNRAFMFFGKRKKRRRR